MNAASVALGLATWLLIGASGAAAQAHEGEFAGLDFRKAPLETLPWGILSKVGVDRRDGKLRPRFLSGVLELEGKPIVLYGYMTAPSNRSRSQRFLLSPRPVFGCECAPLRPEEIVEVVPEKPVAASDAPLAMKGTLVLQREAPDGVLYRLEHARPAAQGSADSNRQARRRHPTVAPAERARRDETARASATR